MSWVESLSDWLVGSARYWALYLITLILGICVVVLAFRPVDPVDPEKIAKAVVRELKAEELLTAEAFDKRMTKVEGAVAVVPSKVLALIKAEGYLTERAFLAHIAELEAGLDEVPKGDKPTPPSMPSPAILPQLPLLFENAKLAPRQSPGEGWRLSPDSEGVRLTQTHQIALNTFVKAFAPCAKVEGRPVRVKVEGYASTRQFADQGGRPLPDTDALNLQAANLRAQGVAGYLRDSAQGFGIDQGFKIDHEPWPSFEAMRRPFVDRSEALQGTEQEALNRSVVVQVHEAGGCQ